MLSLISLQPFIPPLVCICWLFFFFPRVACPLFNFKLNCVASGQSEMASKPFYNESFFTFSFDLCEGQQGEYVTISCYLLIEFWCRVRENSCYVWLTQVCFMWSPLNHHSNYTVNCTALGATSCHLGTALCPFLPAQLIGSPSASVFTFVRLSMNLCNTLSLSVTRFNYTTVCDVFGSCSQTATSWIENVTCVDPATWTQQVCFMRFLDFLISILVFVTWADLI